VPPHLSAAYMLDETWESFPITESAAQTHLSLPIGPHIDQSSVNRVIASLKDFAVEG